MQRGIPHQIYLHAHVYQHTRACVVACLCSAYQWREARKKLSGMGSLFLLWFPGISPRLSALYSTCLPAEPLHQLDLAVFKTVIIFKMDRAASGGCELLDDGLQETLELIISQRYSQVQCFVVFSLLQNFLCTPPDSLPWDAWKLSFTKMNGVYKNKSKNSSNQRMLELWEECDYLGGTSAHSYFW